MHKLNKLQAGHYEFCGFDVEKITNENGKVVWDLYETSYPEKHEYFATLREAKERAERIYDNWWQCDGSMVEAEEWEYEDRLKNGLPTEYWGFFTR